MFWFAIMIYNAIILALHVYNSIIFILQIYLKQRWFHSMPNDSIINCKRDSLISLVFCHNNCAFWDYDMTTKFWYVVSSSLDNWYHNSSSFRFRKYERTQYKCGAYTRWVIHGRYLRYLFSTFTMQSIINTIAVHVTHRVRFYLFPVKRIHLDLSPCASWNAQSNKHHYNHLWLQHDIS